MHFIRAILASLLSLVCTIAVSAFVTLQTINDTVLNRTEVKNWVSTSGTYEKLLPTLLTYDPNLHNQLSVIGGGTALEESTRTALIQTFPSTTVSEAGNRVIDGVYSWIDGVKPTVQFEIDTTSRRDEFIKNLSTQLKPTLTALPTCTSLTPLSSTSPNCLAPGLSPTQAATDMATSVADQLGIFTRPLASDNMTQFTAAGPVQTQESQASQLPQAVAVMRQWLIWLLIVALVGGILAVVLSQHRLKAARQLAGRLTIGLALTCIAGILVAQIAQNVSFGDYLATATPDTIARTLGEPLLQKIIPAVGYRLALISGILGVITLAAWVALRMIMKRREQAKLVTAPVEDTPPATPPANPSAPN